VMLGDGVQDIGHGNLSYIDVHQCDGILPHVSMRVNMNTC